MSVDKRTGAFADLSTYSPYLSRGVLDRTPVQEAAAENLKQWHEAGALLPIEGWKGDILEGYLDILGLNGREAFHGRRKTLAS